MSEIKHLNKLLETWNIYIILPLTFEVNNKIQEWDMKPITCCIITAIHNTEQVTALPS